MIASMAAAAKVEALFKGRQFDQEIIVLCVRWHLRYKLSTRDLVEMMAERGVVLVHTTILGAALRSRIREMLEPLCTAGWRIVGV
jgi:transposase-like protein